MLMTSLRWLALPLLVPFLFVLAVLATLRPRRCEDRDGDYFDGMHLP